MHIQICNRFAHLTELYAILVLGSMVVHGPNFSIQFLCRPHRLSPRALSTVLRNALLFSSERRAEQPIRLWKIGILPLNCTRHSHIFFIWAGMSHNLRFLALHNWLVYIDSVPWILGGQRLSISRWVKFDEVSNDCYRIYHMAQLALSESLCVSIRNPLERHKLIIFLYFSTFSWKDNSGLSSCCQEGDCTAAGAFAHDTRGAALKEMVPSRCKSTTKLTKA